MTTLWIVATPIGNLGDITKRAIDVLKSVDTIVCEDTRTTSNLLNFLGIRGKKLISFYDQVEERRIKPVVNILKRGEDVALVSEAGCPVISDPGYLLVRQCRTEGIRVCVVPGPSAVTAALMVSGIEPIPFSFLGFLPRKKGDIKACFEPFSFIRTTIVFFERKSRLKQSLKIAHEVLKGDREVAIVRELTKKHEEVIFLSLSEYDRLGELKGEITVVISPPKKDQIKTPVEEIREIIREHIKKGVQGGKDVVEDVMNSTTGWSKKEIYREYLRIRNL